MLAALALPAVAEGVADSVVVVERVRVVTEEDEPADEVEVEVRVVELPSVPVVVMVVVDSEGAVVLTVSNEPSVPVVVYW